MKLVTHTAKCQLNIWSQLSSSVYGKLINFYRNLEIDPIGTTTKLLEGVGMQTSVTQKDINIRTLVQSFLGSR